MKRIYILLLILFSIQVFTMGQSAETVTKLKRPKLKLEISAGSALFNENDLKKANAELIQKLPFEVATIDNFPSTYCYGGSISTSIHSAFWLGVSYQYYTSGSRLGAKDYSATYSFDQIISAHSLGIMADFPLLKIEKAEFSCETTAGVHLASWKMEENFTMAQENENDQQALEAIRPFFYPCFKLSYPVTRHIGIAVKGGNSFDIGGKYQLKSDSKIKSDKSATFSGARFSLALEFRL